MPVSEQKERLRQHGAEGRSGRSRSQRRPGRNKSEAPQRPAKQESSESTSGQDMDEKDTLESIYAAETLKEYNFVFVHHFAGRDDPLSEAMKAHAENAGSD